ncbi:MAG: hypothetical protein AVO38_14465 [delta proteobacterium ML8_D]|jgi:2-phosphosulfolactate phosphatase|nr:MAG: hypothetical protein AVO38_14465 [delta proteobacterium ML8_D]
MNVEILEFESGAKKARGLTVVIDVFRAFSVACYAFDSGAARLIAASDVQKAFEFRKIYKNSVLIGERGERKVEGFEFGNSPTEITKADLRGKTVIQTTTAGTNGLIKAVNADILVTGSIVNSSAVIKYIKSLDPRNVSLVAMGYRAVFPAEEDLVCAEIIKSGLEGIKSDFDDRISRLTYSAGRRFFDPSNIDFSPPTDFYLCTVRDRFSFILKGERMPDGNVELIKIDV